MDALKFIADVHLGKLARMLRMLGIDTFYRNDLTTTELVHVAKQQERIILSRSAELANLKEVSVVSIQDKDPAMQLSQILRHYPPGNNVKPFTRCITCNGLLSRASKADLVHPLQPETIRHFNEFWRCRDCGRIYWKGSHYNRMQQRIASIISDNKI